MTRDELFDVLRPIILSVTGVPECILADPNAPAPDGEYASIEPHYSVRQLGQPNVTDVFDEGALVIAETVRRQLLAECSVDFYRGSDTRLRASRLINCNRRTSVSTALRAAGVGWHDTGRVNNLTALQSNQMEQRSQISIFIKYVELDTPENINSIEVGSVDVVWIKRRVINNGDFIVNNGEVLTNG